MVKSYQKIPYRTHTDLVCLINKYDPIASILEKRWANILRNLFNSNNVLFSRICRYSVYNIVTLPWVKILDILCTSIIFHVMVGMVIQVTSM